MITFSLDIDWAPDEVIKDSLMIFKKNNIKCTIFCTHETKILKDCDTDLFEIAIHPNFNPLIEGKTGSVDVILDSLMNVYNQAEGARSHSLTISSKILNNFLEKGLKYDSNIFLPYQTNIVPFKNWNGLVRVPFNWMDDFHWSCGKKFDNCGMTLNKINHYSFAFHPIHIFLNTTNSEHYNSAKFYYHEASKLKNYINTTSPGTRDLLLNIINYVKKNKIITYKLIEIVNQMN